MESDSVCNHVSYYEFAVARFINHEYDYRPTSDDTKSSYQLIISIAISGENCEFSSNVLDWLQPIVRLMINRGFIFQSNSRVIVIT